MILFQLRARGYMVDFNQSHTLFSKKVFHSREEAEGHKERFKVLCTTGDGLFNLDEKKIVIPIIELELD